ncbi:hypothetical protein ALQ04_00017 [Pseudomonas cichorii]|uniref:Uncharacterized protein n=1 Tax=Pseudomonas cichorii TaxID=36746 RepID=A0A3M4LZY7_PSECI|nr:hypothetical protein [Pseudomonas cichorii]RMQ47036.1 hypothetical protein ALQ04_00017 [Pseudomonas cichorii]
MNFYEIVFCGQLVPGAQPDKVLANLGKLFQADEQRLALLFSGRRLVLKSNLDAEAAEKYRSTLERAGAVVEVLDMNLPVEEVELAPPPAESGASQPRTARLQIEPRDVYMAAFVDVDAPDFSVAEVGSDMQDARPEQTAPQLDLSGLSLAPAGSDMGQDKPVLEVVNPDISHLKLV